MFESYDVGCDGIMQIFIITWRNRYANFFAFVVHFYDDFWCFKVLDFPFD